MSSGEASGWDEEEEDSEGDESRSIGEVRWVER